MKLWIARDENGEIYLHTKKPSLFHKIEGMKLVWNSDDWFWLDKNLFPEVTFENSPMEVELKLIDEKSKQ